ncbi:hypothetical protein SLEP1_g38800 [Rubroshorea leprosula]|uniref:CBS domain-containing protein n=1 Tax=Rubroshorea leprosula TaxID=152421 RepID=A0AAV5KYK8_9ROSI|nr:hypothetical protein SLEP1_g38800 [Rubroshorea leprosula]
MCSHLSDVSPLPSPQQEKRLENIMAAEILIWDMTKGNEQVGYWLWCGINHNVDDAVNNVANHMQHVPAIDGKIVGMISIADVVHAVEQQGALK